MVDVDKTRITTLILHKNINIIQNICFRNLTLLGLFSGCYCWQSMVYHNFDSRMPSGCSFVSRGRYGKAGDRMRGKSGEKRVS